MTAGLVSDMAVNMKATTTTEAAHAEAPHIPISEATIRAGVPETSMTEAIREWDVATTKIRRTALAVQTMIATEIAASMIRAAVTAVSLQEATTTVLQVVIPEHPVEQTTDQAGDGPAMEIATMKEAIGETGIMETGITEEENQKNVHGGIVPLTKFPHGLVIAKPKEEEKETGT